VTNSQRTKHVDIQYHFMWEYIEDRYIKIIFIKTAENCADMFTKIWAVVHTRNMQVTLWGPKKTLGFQSSEHRNVRTGRVLTWEDRDHSFMCWDHESWFQRMVICILFGGIRSLGSNVVDYCVSIGDSEYWGNWLQCSSVSTQAMMLVIQVENQ